MPELRAVTVYAAGPGCMPCTQTKRHLDRRGIPFTEIPIHDNVDGAGIQAAIAELGFKTAPVVCVSTSDGEDAWDGYRPDRIDRLVA